jgi:hypothetical protein
MRGGGWMRMDEEEKAGEEERMDDEKRVGEEETESGSQAKCSRDWIDGSLNMLTVRRRNSICRPMLGVGLLFIAHPRLHQIESHLHSI